MEPFYYSTLCHFLNWPFKEITLCTEKNIFYKDQFLLNTVYTCAPNRHAFGIRKKDGIKDQKAFRDLSDRLQWSRDQNLFVTSSF